MQLSQGVSPTSMGNPLPMNIRNSRNQLRKVKVADILSNTDVRFDLVKQIPTRGKLHSNPSPYLILSAIVKLYEVRMVPTVPVKADLCRNLPQRNLSPLNCVPLVYELYRKHFAGLGHSAFLDPAGELVG